MDFKIKTKTNKKQLNELLKSQTKKWVLSLPLKTTTVSADLIPSGRLLHWVLHKLTCPSNRLFLSNSNTTESRKRKEAKAPERKSERKSPERLGRSPSVCRRHRRRYLSNSRSPLRRKRSRSRWKIILNIYVKIWYSEWSHTDGHSYCTVSLICL